MGYGAIAAIIAAITAAITAYTSIQSGKAQKRISDYNAALAERQAEDERLAAADKAERQREQNEALLSRQRLLYNVSGVGMAGTPSDVLMDTASKLELDAQAIKYGGESRGFALETQANIQRMQGAVAKKTGWWNAGTTLLSAASSISGSYAKNDNYSKSVSALKGR